PPQYCLAPFNHSDCKLPPRQVFAYYKPGSRCELEVWRGCPTLNKFDNEYQCSMNCIFRSRKVVEPTQPIDEWGGCATYNKFDTKAECIEKCHAEDEYDSNYDSFEVNERLQDINDLLKYIIEEAVANKTTKTTTTTTTTTTTPTPTTRTTAPTTTTTTTLITTTTTTTTPPTTTTTTTTTTTKTPPPTTTTTTPPPPKTTTTTPTPIVTELDTNDSLIAADIVETTTDHTYTTTDNIEDSNIDEVQYFQLPS
ncbi:hypothetical protein HF086_004360, partial [Spodoptera exigua]